MTGNFPGVLTSLLSQRKIKTILLLNYKMVAREDHKLFLAWKNSFTSSHMKKKFSHKALAEVKMDISNTYCTLLKNALRVQTTVSFENFKIH